MNLNILKNADVGGPLISATEFGNKWLKSKLIDVTENSIMLEFNVTSDMADNYGRLSSVIIMAIIDEIIGTTAFGLGRRLFSTNLKVDIISFADIGATIVADSKILNEEGENIYLECCLYCNSSLIVKGVSHGLAPTKYNKT